MAQTSLINQAKQIDDLAVYGYLRSINYDILCQHEKNYKNTNNNHTYITINNFIPSSIINLCFKYYYINNIIDDKWDENLA